MEAQKAQYDIVYIKNTKKLRSGMVTDEFADDLILASDNVFCKRQADAFSSEELISYLKSKDVSEIEMIPSILVELVNDYEKKYEIKKGEYLFKNKKGGAFNGQTFSDQMIRECNVRGIDCGDYIFRAHDYRHNLATSMYGNGVSIQGVRDYLGHSSENMTKQYIDFMPERIVSAEDKYFSRNQSFKLKGAEEDER